jgi:hypothetical protein
LGQGHATTLAGEAGRATDTWYGRRRMLGVRTPSPWASTGTTLVGTVLAGTAPVAGSSTVGTLAPGVLRQLRVRRAAVRESQAAAYACG